MPPAVVVEPMMTLPVPSPPVQTVSLVLRMPPATCRAHTGVVVPMPTFPAVVMFRRSAPLTHRKKLRLVLPSMPTAAVCAAPAAVRTKYTSDALPKVVAVDVLTIRTELWPVLLTCAVPATSNWY